MKVFVCLAEVGEETKLLAVFDNLSAAENCIARYASDWVQAWNDENEDSPEEAGFDLTSDIDRFSAGNGEQDDWECAYIVPEVPVRSHFEGA
jgi:hypothetical protein